MDGESVTTTEDEGTGDNKRDNPGESDDSSCPRLAVDLHCRQWMYYSVIPESRNRDWVSILCQTDILIILSGT